jgi:hypothetical protein
MMNQHFKNLLINLRENFPYLDQLPYIQYNVEEDKLQIVLPGYNLEIFILDENDVINSGNTTISEIREFLMLNPQYKPDICNV